MPQAVPVPDAAVSTPTTARWQSPLVSLACGLVGFSVVFIGLVVTLRASAERVANPLVFDPAVIDLGEVEIGESYPIQTTLTNRSSRTIEIVGHQVSCGCLTVGAIPESIPAGGTAELSATIEPDRIGNVVQTLWLNVQGVRNQPTLNLQLHVSTDVSQDDAQAANLSSQTPLAHFKRS